MIWEAIASELDLGAWKIDKPYKQQFDRSNFLYAAKNRRRHSPFSSS
jgi:hypothetical protein